MTKKLLVIEGNMGAGKSTLLGLMHNVLSLQVIPEPTAKWQNIGGQGGNILDLFYKDTPRWAYSFQNYAFLTRVTSIMEHMASSPAQMFVLERSVYCDRFCFAKNCFELGSMTSLEWEMYKEWFLWLVENFVPRPQCFIYLRTSPEVAYQRMLKRSRSEESTVSYDYIRLLHQKHEDWLIHKKDLFASIEQIPVLVLDCDQEFENDEIRCAHLMHEITQFINSLDKKTDEQVSVLTATSL